MRWIKCNLIYLILSTRICAKNLKISYFLIQFLFFLSILILSLKHSGLIFFRLSANFIFSTCFLLNKYVRKSVLMHFFLQFLYTNDFKQWIIICTSLTFQFLYYLLYLSFLFGLIFSIIDFSNQFLSFPHVKILYHSLAKKFKRPRQRKLPRVFHIFFIIILEQVMQIITF